MRETIKKRRQVVLLSVLLSFVTVFAIIQYNRANELKYAQSVEYRRVFAELTEYVDDLQISLLKGQVVSTPRQMARLSADLYTQASAAKANLALLPIEEVQMEKTSEFLSQVGEYATCVSEKMLRGEKLSEEEISTMRNLTAYADKLKTGFDEMLLGINEGRISLDSGKNIPAKLLGGGKTAMASNLEILEKEFHSYPSLIYDGPFSHHLTLKEAAFLKGKPQISESQARKYAKRFTEDEEVKVTEINGKLPAYSIKSKSTTVEYTKRGGIMLLLLRDRVVEEENIKIDEAKQIAKNFLSENGFKNMKESYHDKKEGSVVINYAYEQDGYVVFPDLVKVKIALDTGEVIGFESRGYIMNHIYRDIPKAKISQEEALKNINEGLKTEGVSMAVIPLENGGEACCYQIKGVVSGKHFLIYVNTQTGVTEDVQILLESPGGTLAV
jgi:germination protein YpeB